jgi:DNA-binding IclR family transcriptional regulator
VVLRLPVTAQEFASAIGMAAETFSRVLKGLEDDGVIARDGPGRYRVLDRHALAQAAAPPVD